MTSGESMRKSGVVVDTSVLVSGFLNVGPARQVLDRARSGVFRLCLSPTILEETRRALIKPRNLRAYGHSEEAVERFCKALEAASSS